MYNYGFDNHAMRVLDDTDFYLEVPVVGGEEDSVIVSSDDCGGVIVSPDEFHSIRRKIKLENFVYAPIKKGRNLGTIEYFLKGKRIAKHRLYAMNNSN